MQKDFEIAFLFSPPSVWTVWQFFLHMFNVFLTRTWPLRDFFYWTHRKKLKKLIDTLCENNANIVAEELVSTENISRRGSQSRF